jgi:hypothetical protein
MGIPWIPRPKAGTIGDLSARSLFDRFRGVAERGDRGEGDEGPAPYFAKSYRASHGSSISQSKTPQVKAPWDLPP